MIASVEVADGVYTVDLDAEEIVGFAAGERVTAPAVSVQLPLVVAAAAAGSTVVALVERRPPLVVSYDAGRTWTEAGGGLPRGRAVALSADHPDVVLFAARNRLYLSRDGGRFWRALAPELPEITAVDVEGAQAPG